MQIILNSEEKSRLRRASSVAKFKRPLFLTQRKQRDAESAEAARRRKEKRRTAKRRKKRDSLIHIGASAAIAAKPPFSSSLRSPRLYFSLRLKKSGRLNFATLLALRSYFFLFSMPNTSNAARSQFTKSPYRCGEMRR